MTNVQACKEWREFKVWCRERKLKALPAHPWTVAVYLLWLDAHRRYRSMDKRLEVIAHVHVCGCYHSLDRDPIIVRTKKAIVQRRSLGAHKSFTGEELLEPKRSPVQAKPSAQPKKTRLLTQTPPLVLRRPRPTV
jgi:hypothetical protein